MSAVSLLIGPEVRQGTMAALARLNDPGRAERSGTHMALASLAAGMTACSRTKQKRPRRATMYTQNFVLQLRLRRRISNPRAPKPDNIKA